MFGFFKKERFLTRREKAAALEKAEESISRILGFQTLTNGRRVRIKLALTCYLTSALAFSNRSVTEGQLLEIQEAVLDSAQSIEKIKVSDVFYFPNGYDSAIFNFSVNDFVSRSPIFTDSNTWSNGRGITSQVLDVYGPSGVEFILKRRDNLNEAAALFIVTLATGKTDPLGMLAIQPILLDILRPMFTKVRI